MTEKALKNLIDELRALPSETEWVEFKEKMNLMKPVKSFLKLNWQEW